MRPVDLVVPELAAGEQIRWLGTPSLSAILLGVAFPLLFGVAFGIGSFLSLAGVQTEASNPVDIITKLIGIAIGLFVAYPAAMSICATGIIACAITDRRILIVTSRFGKRVQSIDPRWINTLEHKVRADGTGSVLFRIDAVNALDASVTEKKGFRGISDVLGAVHALNQLRAQVSG